MMLYWSLLCYTKLYYSILFHTAIYSTHNRSHRPDDADSLAKPRFNELAALLGRVKEAEAPESGLLLLGVFQQTQVP